METVVFLPYEFLSRLPRSLAPRVLLLVVVGSGSHELLILLFTPSPPPPPHHPSLAKYLRAAVSRLNDYKT
jgi:hypothetical protein